MAEIQESVAIKTNKKMERHHLFTPQSKQKQTSGETEAGVEIALNWNSEDCVIALALSGVTLRRAVEYLRTCFLGSLFQHFQIQKTFLLTPVDLFC